VRGECHDHISIFCSSSTNFNVLIISSLWRVDARCLTPIKVMFPPWTDKKMALIVSSNDGGAMRWTEEQAALWVTDLRSVEMLRLILGNWRHHSYGVWRLCLDLSSYPVWKFRGHAFWRQLVRTRSNISRDIVGNALWAFFAYVFKLKTLWKVLL